MIRPTQALTRRDAFAIASEAFKAWKQGDNPGILPPANGNFTLEFVSALSLNVVSLLVHSDCPTVEQTFDKFFPQGFRPNERWQTLVAISKEYAITLIQISDEIEL